jgi:hypothetical protein
MLKAPPAAARDQDDDLMDAVVPAAPGNQLIKRRAKMGEIATLQDPAPDV